MARRGAFDAAFAKLLWPLVVLTELSPGLFTDLAACGEYCVVDCE